MLENYPDFIITCGPLIGFKIPRKGPIPGIAVDWQDGRPLPPNADEPPASVPRLHNFGTTTYPGGTRTDAKGEAVLHFVPNDEKLPGFGSFHRAIGTTSVVALYQSAFGNVLGIAAQRSSPKFATFKWDVSFHMPRGFRFAGMIKDNDGIQFGKPSGGLSADMYVCGDDPFAPWTGTITWVSEGDPLDFPVTWAFVPGTPFVPAIPTSPVLADGGPFTPGGLDGRLSLAGVFSRVIFTAENF